MRVHMLIPAVVAGLALAAAGCGGGGGRLTKEEYIAQADAICQTAKGKIDALGDPQSSQDLARMADQVASIGDEELSALRELEPPAADESTLGEAYDLLAQEIDLARQVSDAAAAGQVGKVGLLAARGSRIDARANRIAQDYGLKVCGQA